MIFALTFTMCQAGTKHPTYIISYHTIVVIHISQMKKLRHKECVMCPDQLIGQISNSELPYCLLTTVSVGNKDPCSQAHTPTSAFLSCGSSVQSATAG